MKNNLLLILFIIPLLSFGQIYSIRQIQKNYNKVKDTNPDSLVFATSEVLRKSIKDYFADANSKLAGKGALFTATIPKEESASYAINAGFAISFEKIIPSIQSDTNEDNVSVNKVTKRFTKISLSLYAQFDRNTLIDKEQNNLMGGVNVFYNFINYEDFSRKYSQNERRFNIPVKGELTFRRDYQNDIDAFQTSILVSPQFVILDKDERLVRDNWFKLRNPKKLIFDIDLKLGLEYDYRFNAENESLEGNFLRTYSLAKALLSFTEKFKTSIGWEYRQVIANSTSLDQDSFSLLSFNVDYMFKIKVNDQSLNTIEPTIGIVHENGENPTNGFNEQSYWALALSLKI